MDKDFLKDEGDALLVQKYQLNKSQNKLTQIDSTLNKLQEKQAQNQIILDGLMEQMESLLAEAESTPNISKEHEKQMAESLQSVIQDELESTQNKVSPTFSLIEELDSVEFDENMSFSDYVASFEKYAQRNHIDLNKDPFESLMSKTQQIELQKKNQGGI
ncbi:hypothetical protein [Helicobacter sp. UBA3407]|uniref:hypothetical protein n=1 Tax=Helicobacter TaxID=209 RepID=UPI0026329739|nr:hypothetical protein [Helicobacter sp. UBA3407]